MRRTTLEPAEQGFVQYIPASREFEVRDFNNLLRGGGYYWSLPYQYLTKRVSNLFFFVVVFLTFVSFIMLKKERVRKRNGRITIENNCNS